MWCLKKVKDVLRFYVHIEYSIVELNTFTRDLGGYVFVPFGTEILFISKDKEFVKIEDGTGRSKFTMQSIPSEIQPIEPVEFQMPDFEFQNNLADFNAPVNEVDSLPF